MVLETLRSAKAQGIEFWIESQNILSEQSINQHFVNIRIGWNIQAD